MKISSVVFLLLAACGKDTDNKANPCATKGATYFQHLVEANNGTCGTIPDTIINIGTDGTIPGSDFDCDASTQNGCTARNSGCKTNKDGVNCSTTTSMTFKDDGSSASGLISISCSGAAVCSSTYQATLSRQ